MIMLLMVSSFGWFGLMCEVRVDSCCVLLKLLWLIVRWVCIRYVVNVFGFSLVVWVSVLLVLLNWCRVSSRLVCCRCSWVLFGVSCSVCCRVFIVFLVLFCCCSVSVS